MNIIGSIVLSALLTWALASTSKDIGNKVPKWIWAIVFIIFAIGFAMI